MTRDGTRPAGWSDRTSWILAEKSKHYIQRDQPELVIQSVREMLDTIRVQRP